MFSYRLGLLVMLISLPTGCVRLFEQNAPDDPLADSAIVDDRSPPKDAAPTDGANVLERGSLPHLDVAASDGATPDSTVDQALDTLVVDATRDTVGQDAQRPLPDTLSPDTLPSACPAGMAQVPSATGPDFCIAREEGALRTWRAAGADCAAAGKRLCTDAEWVEACLQATALGLIAMTGNWEWVSEMTTPTCAKKRGSVACSSADCHAPETISYATRCCKSLPTS